MVVDADACFGFGACKFWAGTSPRAPNHKGEKHARGNTTLLARCWIMCDGGAVVTRTDAGWD